MNFQTNFLNGIHYIYGKKCVLAKFRSDCNTKEKETI